MYRHYDAQGRVLYVGCTVNLKARNSQHKSNAKWWDKSVRCETVPCATREIAAEYEWREIERLEPLYNVQYNPRFHRWGPMPKRHDYPKTWLYELQQMDKDAPMPDVSIWYNFRKQGLPGIDMPGDDDDA